MRERVTTDQIKLARTVDLISYMQRYSVRNCNTACAASVSKPNLLVKNTALT